jgi:DNA-binding transcriptional ArsR family regulator
MGDADLAAIGAVLAEPARARILLALADGRSLSAHVLASEAGVAASTATHHLARLLDSGLVSVTIRGRYKYFALAGPQVGELIEAIARVAPAQPVTSLRQGTRAHTLRYARSCYDHLAGRLGVAVADALLHEGLLADGAEGDGHASGYTVTTRGEQRLVELGITVRTGDVVRPCLDWTEQRNHIGGNLGRSLLSRLLEIGWLSRDQNTRAVRLTEAGHRGLPQLLGVQLP